jgi:hypothetical protein
MAVRNYSSTAARTTLSAGVTAATTTLTVAATTGFPPAPFILAVNAGAAAQELVLVTNVSGTTLTVTRGYDSTVASAHDAGAVVEHSHAAIEFREANAHVNATTNVHGLGVGSALVGTTDAQTLTNKTLALGSNTLSGTRAQFNAALTDDNFATLAGSETLSNKTLSNPAYTALPGSGAVTVGPNLSGAPVSYLLGGAAIVNANLTATAAIAAGATLFTLPVGHRPVVLVFTVFSNAITNALIRIHVDTAGVVTTQNAIASGDIVRGSVALPL